MHTPVTRLLLLPLLLLTLLVGACQPAAPAALPRLEDPAEIMEETLRTTAELDFAHVRVDASVSGGPLGNQPTSYVIEGDIDLDRRDFHLVTQGGMGDAALALQGVELLVVGTESFVRFQGQGVTGSDKWMRQSLGAGQDPRAGIPPNPAIAVALKTLLEGEGIDTALTGMEACGDAQCYALETTVDSELISQVMGGVLLGVPQPGVGGDPAAPPAPAIPGMPDVVLDIRVDEATRRLISVATSVAYEGITVDVTATVSNHDVKVTFLPPPPDQVDDNTGGMEQQILEDVGNEIPID